VTETADWYVRAATELASTSELQTGWARGVASDPELLALIETLPRAHRQPSLLFSVATWCGAPAVGYAQWREWVRGHWGPIAVAAAVRRTQTNEVGRCIPLLIGLDRLGATHPAPIALLELGAAAGLCLGVDRFSYAFDGGEAVGSGSPRLAAITTGEGAPPTRMPHIAWRAGIDLAPLDVRWLDALLPPDRPDRHERLHAAIATVAADPPPLLVGDALGMLSGVAATIPRGLTIVVACLGTAVYLPPADRAALPDAVAALGGHLLAFESAASLPGIPDRLARMTAPEPTSFVLSLDGEPLAYASAHGDRVSWLSTAV
jgi:hypothetical protein